MKNPILTRILFLFVCISCTQTLFAQKHFQVTIKLDTSIAPERISYHYHDGQRVVTLTDSAKSPCVVFKGNYHSTFASLQIVYTDKAGALYFGIYFVGEKPSEINLYYKPNDYQLLLHTLLVNASDIYDSTTNDIYNEMMRYNKEAYLANYAFYKEHQSQLNSNDTIRRIYTQMGKDVKLRTMDFLKKYSDDYFAFWYFQHEISTVKEFRPDTAFLKKQLTYFQTSFPKKFTESYEGKELIKAYKSAIDPLIVNNVAPNFSIKTLEGKTINLTDLKDKYVLLDFWATWCGPCMKEIPFIKSVRNKYLFDKLVIISVSRDVSLFKLKNAIAKEGMNWDNFFDKDELISKLYGVDVFPTLFLINKERKIIYKSDYIKDDIKELANILNSEVK